MSLKNSKFRYILVIAVVALVFVSYIFTLMRLQLVNGDYYKEQSEKKIYSTETITASRGSIYELQRPEPCDQHNRLLHQVYPGADAKGKAKRYYSQPHPADGAI